MENFFARLRGFIIHRVMIKWFLHNFVRVVNFFASRCRLYLVPSLMYAKSAYIYHYNNGEEKLSLRTSHDHIRQAMVFLCMKEIRRASVLGNVAELGVNRGDFASVLNRLFPDRMLYLFDTFEGFSPKDIETEKAHRFSKASPRHFRRTSVDIVMKKMKHPEKCIIKKGFFPDTAKGLEDRFCFVNLDADLYDPILSGLQYFYPRLEKGGFILVHDYNHDMYKGAGAAVRDFCKETGVAFIPLPDGAGSAIIAK